ncbi:flagellar basal body P-ring protein FlgI [Roseospira marina]|uniref:Flagellar P-ring protein n=1 Tax=Roseospira marina TaxID=140057 RepID=A0A5M6IBT6_9PROT|nr:flagellar basal body P-ring protein FlgI [Roseospira marina]KAA5605754.1 flagellar basal body P-ring protein FlgI [Roseospira marina]MBB4313558.1 flagellar P-ring protein precursor FlgI [Roseospira marina]MBB5086720.1 flagellar P-ring protein precursor FlgI [Roseospira marina]
MTRPWSVSRFLVAVLVLAACALAWVPAGSAWAASRVKDIASFEGVRDNILIGYGLVVGLNGTGDDVDDDPYTRESLIGMLERMGVNTRDGEMAPDNSAAVIVTATLPPFARQGNRIDVTISALGTAENLMGGTLLVTPLLGADGEVYAVAQGQVQVGGFVAQGQAETITKGVPTNGRIPNAAIVEKEVPFELAGMESVKISLRNPDFTTGRRIANAINTYLGTEVSEPLDPGTVLLRVPRGYPGGVVALLTDVEQLRVEPDQLARVVIDEQTGTIVIGENVRIDTVAIAQGNLTIRVTETPQVSQPAPFSTSGQTAVVPRTQIEVDEDEDNQLTVVNPGVTLQDLVNGLNALGVGPRDMISILQAIKAAGAMQAEIQVM